MTLHLFFSFTSSVRVNAYTRAPSLTSFLIWRTWASTAQHITILLTSVSLSLVYDNSINVGAIFVYKLVFSSSVIEVASGEYGDLNPVLFDAVQGGLCSEESKKNSRDKSDSSCPSQYYSVSDLSSQSSTTPLGLIPQTGGLYWLCGGGSSLSLSAGHEALGVKISSN